MDLRQHSSYTSSHTSSSDPISQASGGSSSSSALRHRLLPQDLVVLLMSPS